MQEKKIGLISAENPRYPSAPGGHEALKRDLDTMGVKYQETKGHYGMPERSFIVWGILQQQLICLAQKYGQESIIYIQDELCFLVYVNGVNAGITVSGVLANNSQPTGDYTYLPGYGYFQMTEIT